MAVDDAIDSRQGAAGGERERRIDEVKNPYHMATKSMQTALQMTKQQLITPPYTSQ
jgi:hypothetical protein